MTAASIGAERAPHASGNAMARRNAVTLAVATGLAGANASVVFAAGALVGNWLSGDIGLATLPTTLLVLGTALSTYPIAYTARHFGRRRAFLIGNIAGLVAGLTGAAAIYVGSFWLFCAGTFCAGLYHAVVSSYRYAAADTATPAYRPKAISWVLTGGIASAIIGPQLVIWTQGANIQFLTDRLGLGLAVILGSAAVDPHIVGWIETTSVRFPYLFTFLAQALVAVAAMAVTRRFHDQPIEEVRGGTLRPFLQIAANSRFVVAVVTGTVAQMLMNFVMTAAPLAMHLCGHSLTDSTLGIQWHIIGMFAPSFFTGGLITRFGKEQVAASGLALLAVCAVVNLMGITVAHFWIGLALLGVGWNFAFISATAMITDCHTPSERAMVQGFNDFVIFGTTACGSLLAGYVLSHAGWAVINAAIIPVVLGCVLLVLWVRSAPASRTTVAAE